MDNHLMEKLRESGLCKECIEELSKKKSGQGQCYTICKNCSIQDLSKYVEYERSYLNELENSGISFRVSEELGEKLKNIMETQQEFSKIAIHNMTDFTFVQIGRVIVNKNQLSHIFTTEEFEIGAAFINGYRTICWKCENEEEVFEKLEKITEILQASS